MAKYKAYPEYKDSGVEWLGEIPTHWDCTALKRLCSLITGLTPPTQNEDNYADEGYPWVRPEDLNESGFGTHASKYVSDIGWKLLRHIKPNSTLICCIGTIGKCGYVKETVSTNQQITAATFRDSERFNYYLLQAARAQLEELATGNVLKILNSERLGALNVVKVNCKEANTIAEFLDHETAKIDNLIEKQQQLIELLKEKCQAVISHAVTKGLNLNVPMKYSGVEWLGEVPTHWGIPKLLHVTKAIGDGLHSTPKYDIATGYYFINGNNLVDGKISIGSTAKEVSRDEYNKHYVCLDKKTVLLSINGTIGNVAIYNNEKVILGKSAAYINCGSELDVNYLMYYLITNESRYYFDLEVTGTTIFNLSLNSIRQMKVCIPPLEEQRLIVECCVEKQKQYNYLIDSAEMAIRVMQERRTALISAAVTGKIDVRDWVAPDTQGVEEPQEATA